MANAPKFTYYLTEKQARTLIDAISMQARFFTKHMKTSDINYLRKVEAVMRLQHNRDKSLRQSAYGKPTIRIAGALNNDNTIYGIKKIVQGGKTIYEQEE